MVFNPQIKCPIGLTLPCHGDEIGLEKLLHLYKALPSEVILGLSGQISVRFTEEERAALMEAAGHISLSAFVRDCSIDIADKRLKRKAQNYNPSESRKLLAQILAQLGKSRASSALREILDLARLGALPITPELERKIDDACIDIATIKSTLITALDLRED
jgi:hypothetical protein